MIQKLEDFTATIPLTEAESWIAFVYFLTLGIWAGMQLLQIML